MQEQTTKKPASQSQELRFALFDLWNAKIGTGGMPFETFYREYMAEEIQEVRDEINKLSNPEII